MRISVFRSLFSVLVALAVFGSCAAQAQNPAALSATNVNLIFVVSEDLAYNAAGDINTKTANLTDQGLRRSLLLASFLQKSVLGSHNVTAIYALEPMTHLQTSNSYPDLAALGSIQQFALQNQIVLSSDATGGTPLSENSFPLDASYAPPPVTPPSGVAAPLVQCRSCQGLDFSDQDGDNESLLNSILQANRPGFYVFSAPWETVGALLANINQANAFNIPVPSAYAGPNVVYAISLAPSGTATLTTYNANLIASATYPVLPSTISVAHSCTATPFSISVRGGVGGTQIPAAGNTNEVIYMIRHAEAHPTANWDDGNYDCAGQWRALSLPDALRDKVQPQVLYSIDPAQTISGSVSSSNNSQWSYVRAALTLEPYAAANNLPYGLAASFEFAAQNPPTLSTQASNFFFTGGQLSNQTVLLSWEHNQIPNTVNALLASYFPNGGAPTTPAWAGDDYDSIWTITLDSRGNLTVDNNLCEGIASSSLPATCPAF
jgi:hypothetical protein